MSWEEGGDNLAYHLHPSKSLMFSKIRGPLGIAEAGRFLEQQAGTASQGAGAGTMQQGDGTKHCSRLGSAGVNCQPCGGRQPFWDHWLLAGVKGT